MKLCTECFYAGEEQKQSTSKFWIELLLWSATLVTGIIGLFVPLLWIATFVFMVSSSVYSSGRSKASKICPRCKSHDIIPLDTPRAEKIIKGSNIPLAEWFYKSKSVSDEGI